MNRINIQPQAIIDIEEAAEWYEEQQAGLGIEFVLEVDEALERAASDPENYEIKYKKSRQVLLRRFPYSAYFLHEDNAVEILAVLHQRRKPSRWRKRVP